MGSQVWGETSLFQTQGRTKMDCSLQEAALVTFPAHSTQSQIAYFASWSYRFLSKHLLLKGNHFQLEWILLSWRNPVLDFAIWLLLLGWEIIRVGLSKNAQGVPFRSFAGFLPLSDQVCAVPRWRAAEAQRSGAHGLIARNRCHQQSHTGLSGTLLR